MTKEIKYNLSEKAVIYGLSIIIGIIVSAVMLLLSAAFYLATDMNEMLISPLSGICVGVGSLMAGFLASKKIKSSGVLNGAVCGVLIYILVLFISLFFSTGGFSLISIFHAVIIIICGMIGGVLGIVSTSKRNII